MSLPTARRPQPLARPSRAVRHLLRLGLALAFLLPPMPASADPVPGLELRLSPADRTLRVGEAVVLEADVLNRGPSSWSAPSSGVGLNVTLPEGFSFREADARVTTVSGAVVPARFRPVSGRTFQLQQSRDGTPATLNLGAGQALRFRLVLAASSRVRPFTTASVVVAVADPAGAPLSSDVTVRLRIEPDPELALGWVAGSVFCDDNANGARDPNEPGLGGVRLVSDTGRAVDTDRDGRWHLRDLRPGAHLIKLDAHTLPPQATLLGSPRALLDLTPGLPTTASFAVRCAFVEATPTTVIPPARPAVSPASSPPAGPPTPAPDTPAWATIRGSTTTLDVHAGAVVIASGRVSLEASPSAGAMGPGPFNLPWSPRGLAQPIPFRARTDAIDGVEPLQWELTIVRSGTLNPAPLRVLRGPGPPPASIVWDGRTAEGAPDLQRGALYEARIRLTRAGPGWRDVLTSAPLLLGTGWEPGRTPADFHPIARTDLVGRYFDADDRPNRRLDLALKDLGPLLASSPGAIVLATVELPPGDAPELIQLRAGRQAFAVGEVLRRLHGLPASRVLASAAPPAAEPSSPRLLAGQSRLALTLEPAAPAELHLPELAVHAPAVRLSGLDVPTAPDGSFTTLAPAGEEIPLSLRAHDDARRELLLTPSVDPAAERAQVDLIAADPLAAFGGSPVRDALGPAAVAPDVAANGPLTANQLTILLPARNSELATPRLFVHGRTHPSNVLAVADQPIHVAPDGRFGQLVAVAPDTTTLRIESRDPAGNTASLDWPLRVSQTEFMLLALADTSVGQAGARLTELAHYDRWKNDDLFVAGRGALYAKGRISGALFGKELRFAAHIDSTRRDGFDPFFQQIIDPARDYVVFGDASDDLFAANTRGPVYVLVELDRSKLGWGSFHTDMRGVHLFRYERTFDGAHADLDFEVADGWRTRVKAFASSENRRLVRRYDELRATGGSVYYTSTRNIARGSERVDLVLRELDTGMELGRSRLERDRHYRVDYLSGRILTEAPIPSVVDAFFSIDGYQPFGGRSVLDGHQVWLVVSYEADAAETAGDIAFGAQGIQEIAGVLEVGGGVAREGRPAGAGGSDPSYLHWGVHAKVKASENSWAALEYARSRAKEGVAFRSTDGGLRFDDLDRATRADEGWALFATLQADIAELAGAPEESLLDLEVRGHWQLLQPGFRTAGLAHEEGTEKWGGEVVWRPSEDISARLRYDGGTFLLDPPPDAETDTTRAIIRNRLLARYDQRLNPTWSLFAEATVGQHRNDLTPTDVPTTGGVSVGLRWRVLPSLTLSLSQDSLHGGDDRVLGDGALARLQTNLGVELGLTDDTAFRLVQTLRWNGDNATRIGLVNRLADGTRTYLEERLERGAANGRLIRSSVVGAETPWGGADGRAFGEYRLDGGVGGHTNRAVLGLGRAFELAPGVRTTLAYERSQALDAPGGSGRGARDVLAGGLQLLAFDRLKLNGIFEVRWDRDRPAEAAAEAFQGVARANADFKLGDDFTIIGLLDYVLTQDLATRAVLAENAVGSLGLAWRPLDDDLIMVLRWSRVIDRQGHTGVDLFGEVRRWQTRETSDLLSLAGVVELPLRLQLTQKLAWRRSSLSTGEDGLSTDSDALLWVSRLAVHLLDTLDIAGEFRALFTLYGRAVEQNGGLVEASWRIADHARLGVGWNINGLAGGVLPGEAFNDIQNGFFVRMSGMY
jgi:hypothetical protein